MNWDTRDDESRIQPSAMSAGQGMLFDVNGNPKLVIYDCRRGLKVISRTILSYVRRLWG